MESYLTYYYEYHFLYLSGIEHVESKNIESSALIKLQFYPGTDMAQALAETIDAVNRSKAFMPEGVVPPFVMRFDAGSEPVGKLVFTSEDKSRIWPNCRTLPLTMFALFLPQFLAYPLLPLLVLVSVQWSLPLIPKNSWNLIFHPMT